MQHCVHSSRDDADLLDNEVTGVENDTALDVAARSHGLHEGLGDGLLVGPQILINLLLVMPMPLSRIAMVELILSGMILMWKLS